VQYKSTEKTIAKRTRKPKQPKDQEARTLVDIISDTRSGVPIPAAEITKFQKKPKQVNVPKPLATPVTTAIVPQAPVLNIVNGQAVIQMPVARTDDFSNQKK
jgi:hypothetical protein